MVPTLNRGYELRLLMQSLKAQTFRDFEVLVIDQNENDLAVSAIADFKADLNIIHIRQKEKGASLARNNGIENASGRIITFPDDDCEYPNDLLENVLKIFEADHSLTGITCASTSRDGRGSIARMSHESGLIDKLNILPRMVEFTMFMRAESLQHIRFDEDYGPGSKKNWSCDEGPDLMLRMMERGAKFFFHADLIIYHPNPAKVYDQRTFTRSFNYGTARGRFLRKHNYPFWYVMYVWGLYVAGIGIGIAQFNKGKIEYYYHGLKGRIQGYFLK